jgi:hypothetical protein
MSRNLIPYSGLKGKGITYSKPHVWRLEKMHAEMLRKGPPLSGADQPSVPPFPLRVPIGASRYAYVPKAGAVPLADRDMSSCFCCSAM